MSAFPEDFWKSEEMAGKKELFKQLLRKTIVGDKKNRIIVNGNYTISYTPRPDGSIPEYATNRIKSIIDSLHQKFPPATKKLSFSITTDPIDTGARADSTKIVLGATRIPRDFDLSNLVLLSEPHINSATSIGVQRGWYQASDASIPISTWTIVHEWGHATDRHLIDPEPPELFETWSKPGVVGMSQYGRYSREEAYAEAFADWVTSEGTTQNPATLAYAEFYQWEIP